MATTKVIKDLTEFNPGNPDYVLNATNAVTVINSGGNQYNFNGVYGKFGLRIGTTVLTGVPSGHPIAVLNNGLTGITYTGTVNEGTLAVGGVTYTFYSGDVTITVTADFGVASYYCKIHGYMGGQDNLVSVYSEAGLRMPTGGAFSGTPAEGMMRNDTSQSSLSSASTMQHYTGNNEWKNFVNVTNCTTSTCGYPVTATALWQLNGNASDSCAVGPYNGAVSNITYASGKFGQAAQFNGSSSVITTTPGITGNPTFTISFWVYPSGFNGTPLMFGTATSGQAFLTFITSNYQMNLGSWGNSLGTTTATMPNGQWTSIVIVNNGGSVQSYVNGNADLSFTHTYNITGSNLYIGAANNTQYFNGAIDQVRLFPTALSSSQAAQIAAETC